MSNDAGASAITTKRNSNLHAAKRGKNDEFYTQLGDIEREVKNYWSRIGHPDEVNPFRDKIILLNCDDPNWSNFWRYFALQFDHLGLRELISTHYEPEGSPSYAMHLDRDTDGTRNDYGLDGHVPLGRRVPLTGNGDFRSPECGELLEHADIVVTNPPFSLFREFITLLVGYGKDFLIVGSQNAITYKEVFPLLQGNVVWLGVNNGGMEFRVSPDSDAPSSYERDGVRYQKLGNIAWFTNLDHRKRHEDLPLAKYYEGHEDEYPRYDNYDAINVNKTNHIPMDYTGVMGVPITFLDKHNPDQFEIVGFRHGSDGRDLRVAGKTPYFRILVRNRRPEPKVDFRKAIA